MKFTILRLKRKRNEEPLDALVVQQLLTNDNNRGGKKARRAADNKLDNMITQRSETSPSVFRYAETVDEKSFDDATQTTQLRERIARLVNRKETLRTRDSDSRRIKQLREQQIAQFNDDMRRERYRVINRNRFEGKEGLFNTANDDDDEEDEKEEKEEEDTMMEDTFKMYDAVKETEVQVNANIVDDSETIDNFTSLVQEYLTLQDRAIEHPPEAGIEYVYDIFYKDDSTLPTENTRWQNVASAIWSNGENEVLLDDDSSSSQYFTDDEDSNAEDHYTHDYPDEDEEYSDKDSDYHEADSYHDADSDNYYEDADG